MQIQWTTSVSQIALDKVHLNAARSGHNDTMAQRKSPATHHLRGYRRDTRTPQVRVPQGGITIP